MNTYFAALAVTLMALTGFAGEAVAAPHAHTAATAPRTAPKVAPKPVAKVTPRPAPVKVTPRPAATSSTRPRWATCRCRWAGRSTTA